MSINVWRSMAATAPATGVILDIGAYIGEFALAARAVNKASEIYAFEPNPDSLNLLKPVCKKNKIGVVDKAISNKNEKVLFQCNSRISAITKDASNGNTIQAQAITLDSWVKKNHKIPYLIKIDVEDASGKTLQGAKNTLNKHRPIIICEVLTNDVGEMIAEVLPASYSRYLINENNGLEAKKEIKRYDWRYTNWLFLTRDKKHLIEDFLINKK